jgi:succinate dehydrogenase/fumarate reductase flavoprotein subunit
MLSPRNLAVAALLGLSSAQDTYDYVIIGGGVSGLVVANRLTEDKKSKTMQPSQMYAKLT